MTTLTPEAIATAVQTGEDQEGVDTIRSLVFFSLGWLSADLGHRVSTEDQDLARDVAGAFFGDLSRPYTDFPPSFVRQGVGTVVGALLGAASAEISTRGSSAGWVDESALALQAERYANGTLANYIP